MGPIKKFLWRRKYKNTLGVHVQTMQLLQILAKLGLWYPSQAERISIQVRITLNQTLGEMARILNSFKLGQ